MDPVECRTYEKPAEVTTRLNDLGVTMEDLRTAVQSGDRQAAQCTANDPKTTPGFYRWAKTFRRLADNLTPKKWVHEERRNLPLMIAASGDLAIGVSSASAETGLVGTHPHTGDPKTRNPKGLATRSVVARNQLSIPGVGSVVTLARKPGDAKMQTWFLLYYADEETDEVRCELSLPAGVAEDDRVGEWFERIILPSLPRLGPAATEDVETEDIDIPVQRREVE